MNPYITGGLVLTVIIMGGFLKNAVERNGELEQKLKTQAEATQLCVDVNENNTGTIESLRTRIVNMVRDRETDRERREAALVERERELAAARAEADALRREREDEKNENAECKEATALVLADVCPATAEQLRIRSRGEGS